jgi:hypothetical protein
MALETVFSESNMEAYSSRCLDLAVSMPEQFDKHSLDTLVIPSRGAVPIFIGSIYALGKLNDALGGEYNYFHDNLGIQNMLGPLMPHKSNVQIGVDHHKYKVLLIPFTADLNLNKFDSSIDTDDFVEKTRNYWARFTSSFFEKSSKRLKDPYFNTFTDVILRNVENRSGLAEAYETFPQIKRFGIMDTVISGRASTHILSAFDRIFKEQGIDDPQDYPYYGFLIVDENGSKLKRDFKTFLKTKEARRSLEMHYIPRIVSEDEGASLLGVAAVVYPSLMRESKKNLVIDKNLPFFVGAGSWRLGKDLGVAGADLVEGFNKFKNVIYSGIDYVFAKDYTQDAVDGSKGKFNEARRDFIRFAESSDILAKNNEIDTSVLNIRPDYVVKNPYETGSRVAHIPFDENSTQRIIAKICINNPRITCENLK